MNTAFTNSIELVLKENRPLKLLFSHKCSDQAHALFESLAVRFKQFGMDLQLDPFKIGEDLEVKMKSLPLNGLVFHSTPLSFESSACKLEIETALRISAPVFVIVDGHSPPTNLKRRLYSRIPNEHWNAQIAVMCSEMSSRAAVHFVLQWLMGGERTVHEREAGCEWLLLQESQILGEFLILIDGLYRKDREDNIIARMLASIVGQTNLPEACVILSSWLRYSTHPNTDYGIKCAMAKLGCIIPP